MSRRGWVLFLAMCVIWGVPYLLIKVAVADVAPSVVVCARTGLAALILVPIALARGQFAGLRAVWPWLLLYTLAEIGVPFICLGYAETRLTSSLTGLLIAAVPLVGALLAKLTGSREPLGRRRLAGLLLGVAGVAALVGLDVGRGSLPALLAMIGVVVGYATGPIVLARRLADRPGLGVVAASLLIAAVGYLPAAVVQAPHHWPSGRVLAALAGLAVLCTAIAFLVFFQLVGEVGPARATVITYINPAVALLLGAVVLGERVTWATLLGFALVLAGSVLATSRTAAERPVPEGDPESVSVTSR